MANLNLLLLMALWALVNVKETIQEAELNDNIEVVNEEEDDEDPRKIKGEQYTHHTLLTKVVGGSSLSDDMLEFLRNDQFIMSNNTPLVTDGNGSMAYLVTEKLQTTLTRITVPLSASFMDSEWYRNTLKKFLQKNRLAAGAEDGKEFSETGPDVELLVLKLWAAATFRDNINKVFGYLLYHPRANTLLKGDLHGALAHIHNLVKLRRVPLVDSLHILPDMSFNEPRVQLISLFEELESLVPRYVRSCITYWLEHLYDPWGQQLNTIMQNPSGSLAVDLLEGIDSRALLALKTPLLYPKQVARNLNWDIVDVLGKTLAGLAASLSSSRVELTQQIFGGVLLHMPLNRISPESEEYLRHVVHSLKSNVYSDFQEKVKGLVFTDNLFNLVDDVLLILSPLNILNNEQMDILSNTIQAPLKTFELPNYSIMSTVLEATNTMELLLTSVVPQEYPADVVDAKTRLLYYLNKSYVDVEELNRGFVRETYGAPVELLIATLSRMDLRSSQFAPEVMETISVLKSHIIFKEVVSKMGLGLTLPDLASMMSSFQSPRLPDMVKQLAADIKELLAAELHELHAPPSVQSLCARPRQCVVAVLNAIRGQITNHTLELKVGQLLALLDKNGELVVFNRRSLSNNCEEVTDSDRLLETGKQQIYPGRNRASLYNGEGYDLPLYVTRLGLEVAIMSSDHELLHKSKAAELKDVPINTTSVPHPGLLVNSTDPRLLLPFSKDVDPTVKLFLESVNKLSQRHLQQSRGRLLLTLLTRAIEADILNLTAVEAVKNYRDMLSFVYNSLPPPPPVSPYRREVNYPSLLEAIPVAHGRKAAASLEKLRTFFSRPDFHIYTDGYDGSEFKTKGTYLQSLLLYLVETSTLKSQPELLALVRSFIDKPRLTGYGAQPVEWVDVLETEELVTAGQGNKKTTIPL